MKDVEGIGLAPNFEAVVCLDTLDVGAGLIEGKPDPELDIVIAGENDCVYGCEYSNPHKDTVLTRLLSISLSPHPSADQGSVTTGEANTFPVD